MVNADSKEISNRRSPGRKVTVNRFLLGTLPTLVEESVNRYLSFQPSVGGIEEEMSDR